MTEQRKIHVVCTGACTLNSNKTGLAFHRLEDDGSLGKPLYFDRKSKVVGAGKVGSVYELGLDENGTTVYGPMRWVRSWDGADMLLAWKAQDDLTRTLERNAKAQKAGEKAAADKAMLALEPIRQLYHQTDRLGRNLLEAQVMEYIRRNPMYDATREGNYRP